MCRVITVSLSDHWKWQRQSAILRGSYLHQCTVVCDVHSALLICIQCIPSTLAQVTTADGFVLGLQRISMSRSTVYHAGSMAEAKGERAKRKSFEHEESDVSEPPRRRAMDGLQGMESEGRPPRWQNDGGAGDERADHGWEQRRQQERKQQEQSGTMGAPVLLQHGLLQVRCSACRGIFFREWLFSHHHPSSCAPNR